MKHCINKRDEIKWKLKKKKKSIWQQVLWFCFIMLSQGKQSTQPYNCFTGNSKTQKNLNKNIRLQRKCSSQKCTWENFDPWIPCFLIGVSLWSAFSPLETLTSDHTVIPRDDAHFRKPAWETDVTCQSVPFSTASCVQSPSWTALWKDIKILESVW